MVFSKVNHFGHLIFKHERNFLLFLGDELDLSSIVMYAPSVFCSVTWTEQFGIYFHVMVTPGKKTDCLRIIKFAAKKAR